MVSKKLKVVVVDDEAKKSLREAYHHIKKDNLENAEKVKAKILISIKELIKNLERHGQDEYRLENHGSYRA